MSASSRATGGPSKTTAYETDQVKGVVNILQEKTPKRHVTFADTARNEAATVLQVPGEQTTARDASRATEVTAPAASREPTDKPQDENHMALRGTEATAHAASGSPGDTWTAGATGHPAPAWTSEAPGVGHERMDVRGARPRTHWQRSPSEVENFTETLSLANTILHSPETVMDDLMLNATTPSPPSLEPSGQEEQNGSVNEAVVLPTEGIIDHVDRCASSGAGFYTTWYMGKAKHTVLVDTGCTYTLIPRRLYDQTGLPFHPVGEIRLRLASGQHFMYGAWIGPVEFKIGHQFFKRYIVVAESGSEPILGMDFMRSNSTALLISEGMLLLNGEPIQLINENEVSPTPKVVSVRRVTIEPGACKLIEGKLDKKYSKPLICEALEDSPAIAEIAEYRPEKKLHVLVWNPTNKYLTLKPGKEIASTEEMHPLY